MFALRLKELREKAGLSQKAFAMKLGVSQSTVGMWESKKREPNFKTIEDIAEFFDTTTDYLLGRDNNMRKRKVGLRVPVLGYVAAGIPIEEIEDVLDYEELDSEEFNSNCEYFGLKIKGDSMLPRIQNGDVVIVRQQSDVDSGEIAIVRVNGEEATCKQLKKHADGITLISFNSAYEPMFFTWQEVAEKPVAVIGKVVELRGKF